MTYKGLRIILELNNTNKLLCNYSFQILQEQSGNAELNLKHTHTDVYTLMNTHVIYCHLYDLCFVGEFNRHVIKCMFEKNSLVRIYICTEKLFPT